jgi:alpha-ketoglutarate-dependent taurine dioxygenase
MTHPSGADADRTPAFTARRRGVRLAEGAVRVTPPEGTSQPAVVRAVADGVDPGAWLAEHRAVAGDLLDRYGAVVLRGFDSAELALQSVVERFSGELFEYAYRSTPRSTVAGRVYTSTEYPADQSIPLHNEMSYAARWPRRLWLLCVRPADEGGATPVADSRVVRENLPAGLRDRFERLGVQYRRRYGPHLDLPWQETFQTTDRSEVDAVCRSQGLRHTWLDDDHLLTSEVRPAVLRHPGSGALVWFNQAHLFHVSAHPAPVRDALLRTVGEEGLPRAAYFGDGSPIADDDIAAIGAAYAEAAADVDWQAGDLLLADNEAVAHGRRPFRGARRVVVAMSDGSGAS